MKLAEKIIVGHVDWLIGLIFVKIPDHILYLDTSNQSKKYFHVFPLLFCLYIYLMHFLVSLKILKNNRT